MVERSLSTFSAELHSREVLVVSAAGRMARCGTPLQVVREEVALSDASGDPCLSKRSQEQIL